MALETRSAKGAATRDQILDAATRLIHLRGYHNTSLDDVLRESGVGKGNFYYYFKSKEELGYAILDRLSRLFADRVLGPAFADASVDPVMQLDRFLDRLLDSQRQRNCVGGCPMGNLASELSDVHEGFRQRLVRIFDSWRDELSAAVDRGRSAGRLHSECEPRALAQFIVAAVEGAILLAKVTKDISVMEACIDHLKRHLALCVAAPLEPSIAPGDVLARA